MKLYLLRHAKALDGEDDALRPLSQAGRNSIAALACFLQSQALLDPLRIWHSRLLRSQETAQVLKTELGWKRATLRSCDGIEPEASPVEMALKLESMNKDLLLVGHEPHLGKLASLLLCGEETKSLLKLRKCTLLCLERKQGKKSAGAGARWRLLWQLSPELFTAPDKMKSSKN